LLEIATGFFYLWLSHLSRGASIEVPQRSQSPKDIDFLILYCAYVV
jgi:hypothetical protein